MKKPWRRFWRFTISFTLLMILLYAGITFLAHSWRNVPVNPSTTRLTAPLASDGFPDYLAALNTEMSAGVTPDNNAAPGFYAILAPDKTPSAWLPLLAAAHPATDHHFILFHRWCLDHPNLLSAADQKSENDFETDELNQTLHSPWSPADHPAVAAYLEANSAALDALESLTARDRFYLPFVPSDALPKGDSRPTLLYLDYPLGGPKEAANAMIQRALLRLSQHDYAGFQSDITASLCLSDLLLQQNSIFHYLAACAIHNPSVTAIAQASLDPAMPTAILQNLQSTLDALPPWPTPAHLFDTTERYTLLEDIITCLDGVKHDPAVAGSSASASPDDSLPIHFAHALSETNRYCDAWRDAFDQPLYTDRRAAINRTDTEIDSIGSSGILDEVRHIDTFILVRQIRIKNAQPLNRFMTIAIAHHRLTRIALAIALYRRAHTNLPSTLIDLSLPADLLIDPFTAKPFLYKPTATPYLLYSVGPDLTDDGGKPLDLGDKSKPFDITAFAGFTLPTTRPAQNTP